MTTQMQEAFKQVGIKVPNMKRIWLWVQDHPYQTVREISAGLGLKEQSLQTYLKDMEKRKMIVTTSVKRNYFSKPIKAYAVAPAMRGFYEILPLPPEEQAKKKTWHRNSVLRKQGKEPLAQPPVQAAPHTPDAPSAPPAPPAPPAPREDAQPKDRDMAVVKRVLESLTIAQARLMYNELYQLFDRP